MGLRRESQLSTAGTDSLPGSLFDLIASQLWVLIDQFGLGEQRQQILDTYGAIGRDSLDFPVGTRPNGTSAINHDGTPFQYALTLGVPSRILAFLGDVGPLDGKGAERMANNRGCLNYLDYSLGIGDSIEGVEDLLDALSPPDNPALLGEPAGPFWIGAGFTPAQAPRLKIYINDRWGHDRGDLALREFASVLKKTFRRVDQIFRFGGEEFVVLLPRLDREKAQKAAERVGAAIREHVFLQGETDEDLRLTASVGGAIYPLHAGSETQLFRMADEACYRAKRAGKDRAVFPED